MNLQLHRAPWSAFVGQKGIDLQESDVIELDWVLLPRLVGRLPLGFRWNRCQPMVACWGQSGFPHHYDVALPDQGRQHRCGISVGKGDVIEFQSYTPRAREENREEDVRERWLQWQYLRYKELAHVTESHTNFECPLSFGARREWPTVQAEWSKSSEDHAELSLIVELAERSKLITALERIAARPRRMLRRVHRSLRMPKIQEMDHQAIRDLCRRPGRTPAEKAGPKQELIAVVREDTTDLPENRVLLWCVRRMERMARAWCHRNILFRNGERYMAVHRLLLLLHRLSRQPDLKTVSPLQHHMVTPTYCFQFERQYREVWRMYLLIRREEKAIDDLWRWQGHLWGSTTRLILASLLFGIKDWSEERVSTPYFRSEGTCGEWTAGPSTPGPWRTPQGTCQILDSRDMHSQHFGTDIGLPPDVLSSGADTILAMTDEKKIILTWSCLSGKTQHGLSLPDLDALDTRLDRLVLDCGWKGRSIVFLAEPEATGDEVEWVEELGRVRVLRLPTGLHYHWDDLKAGLELVLEDTG